MNILENWMPLVLLTVFFSLGLWVGFEIGKYRTHVAAVRAGVGEFYLPDKEDTLSEFRWKTSAVNIKGE